MAHGGLNVKLRLGSDIRILPNIKEAITLHDLSGMIAHLYGLTQNDPFVLKYVDTGTTDNDDELSHTHTDH